MADTETLMAEIASVPWSSLCRNHSPKSKTFKPFNSSSTVTPLFMTTLVLARKKARSGRILFAEDGIAIYPYGQHHGRQGKGAGAFGGVSYFERCQLLSSNFDIEFSPNRKRAYVRTNCIAQWMKRREI
ncbi:uncharacterized protein Z518_09120 [Rhinocladiella mackenziei CBS 650.93]|uniref:Rhinocladiella mackenziei CBS 650.93 unplaced genomic scaffold supercont1.7, whole genome shotgun sequence n=1 Tax=Rhinocladiella mackenziei CBS 650.93 TaxID=1442369 RepID=A0A0D2I6G2_9EURO|nr:uncharacterized protein Z518_09120 [Rhinocladiella mackenziei CBS 650.93]KIX01394.1 hypothetical protein Z518_09120 [Rhinocladiella mackenziei CBS 650.93]